MLWVSNFNWNYLGVTQYSVWMLQTHGCFNPTGLPGSYTIFSLVPAEIKSHYCSPLCFCHIGAAVMTSVQLINSAQISLSRVIKADLMDRAVLAVHSIFNPPLNQLWLSCLMTCAPVSCKHGNLSISAATASASELGLDVKQKLFS